MAENDSFDEMQPPFDVDSPQQDGSLGHDKGEQELIATARQALSQCNWTVGECASKWTTRYARGRTDADFGALVGLSADQIYQRRRVWDRFGETHEKYQHLSWSHFYTSINWEDAEESLNWAEEFEATVAEMRAWRRANRGEDLTVDADDQFQPGDHFGFLPATLAEVRDPNDFEGEGGASSGEYASVGGGGDREQEPYTPFRKEARGEAFESEGSPSATAVQDEISAEQRVRRMTRALHRYLNQLSPAVMADIQELPAELSLGLLDAAEQLSERLQQLR